MGVSMERLPTQLKITEYLLQIVTATDAFKCIWPKVKKEAMNLHNGLACMGTSTKSCFSIAAKMWCGWNHDLDFAGLKKINKNKKQKKKTWRPRLHEEVSGYWLCQTVLCRHLIATYKKTSSHKSFICFREELPWIFRYQSWEILLVVIYCLLVFFL